MLIDLDSKIELEIFKVDGDHRCLIVMGDDNVCILFSVTKLILELELILDQILRI